VVGREFLELRLVAQHLVQHVLGVLGRQALGAGDRLELAVQARQRVRGHLEVDWIGTRPPRLERRRRAVRRD
jgi:hypothetical protein